MLILGLSMVLKKLTHVSCSPLVAYLATLGFVCFIAKGCGLEDLSRPTAVQSDGKEGLVDRVYLAMEDYEISDIKVKSLYVIGCREESRNPSFMTQFRTPNGEVVKKPLDRRLYLDEFDAVDPSRGDNPKEQQTPSYCEVLFGNPSVKGIRYEPSDGGDFKDRLTMALASTGSLLASINTLRDRKIEQKSIKIFAQIFGTLSGGVLLYWFGRNTFRAWEGRQEKKVEEQTKSFVKMFELVAETTINELENGKDSNSLRFRALSKSFREIEQIQAASIFTERLVKNFNNNQQIWENKSVKGTFKKSEEDLFFKGIQELKQITWDEGRTTYYIPYEESLAGDSKCLYMQVKPHRIIEQDGAAFTFADRSLKKKIGQIPVGTKLLYLEKFPKKGYLQPAVRKVEFIPESTTIESGRSFYIHDSFLELDRSKCLG